MHSAKERGTRGREGGRGREEFQEEEEEELLAQLLTKSFTVNMVCIEYGVHWHEQLNE